MFRVNDPILSELAAAGVLFVDTGGHYFLRPESVRLGTGAEGFCDILDISQFRWAAGGWAFTPDSHEPCRRVYPVQQDRITIDSTFQREIRADVNATFETPPEAAYGFLLTFAAYPGKGPVTLVALLASGELVQLAGPNRSILPPWGNVIPLPPPDLMGIVGAPTVDNFLLVGDAWAQLATRYCPEAATVLDIGCGCGRIARILFHNRWITRYIGFDVVRRAIEWCNRYIAPAWNGEAYFLHYDLFSAEYNPAGGLLSKDFVFPCEDAGADLILAASLFTHLLEPDTIRYLQEVGRVISPRGRALLTIHNVVPPGERYVGTETRIDMDPNYFAELALAAGLQEESRIEEFCGQQMFVFARA